MGGQFEKTLENPKPASVPTSPAEKSLNEMVINLSPAAAPPVCAEPASPNLRIHENNGEVHIHDDTNKKKVALEARAFRSGWKKFSSCMIGRERMVMVGKDGRTAAVFRVDLQDLKPLDVIIDVIELSPTTNLSKIENLVAGR